MINNVRHPFFETPCSSGRSMVSHACLSVCVCVSYIHSYLCIYVCVYPVHIYAAGAGRGSDGV